MSAVLGAVEPDPASASLGGGTLRSLEGAGTGAGCWVLGAGHLLFPSVMVVGAFFVVEVAGILHRHFVALLGVIGTIAWFQHFPGDTHAAVVGEVEGPER